MMLTQAPVPPPDAVKVDLMATAECPGCRNQGIPDVVDYSRRELENPGKWRVRLLYALFQCKRCGALYYIYEEQRKGTI